MCSRNHTKGRLCLGRAPLAPAGASSGWSRSCSPSRESPALRTGHCVSSKSTLAAAGLLVTPTRQPLSSFTGEPICVASNTTVGADCAFTLRAGRCFCGASISREWVPALCCSATSCRHDPTQSAATPTVRAKTAGRKAILLLMRVHNSKADRSLLKAKQSSGCTLSLKAKACVLHPAGLGCDFSFARIPGRRILASNEWSDARPASVVLSRPEVRS